MTVPLILQFRSRFPQWRSRPATSRHPPRCLPLRFHLMPVTHHLSSHHLLRSRPHHLSQRASHRSRTSHLSLTSHHSRSRRCSTRPLARKSRRCFLPLPRRKCHLSPRSRQRRLPLHRSTRRRATKSRPCLSYLRSPLSRPVQRNRRPFLRPPKHHPAGCRAGFPSRLAQARVWQPTPTARSELTSSSTYLSRSSGM